MDRRSAYTLSVLAPDFDNSDDTRGQVQNQLEQFILQFRLDNVFIYRSAHYFVICDSMTNSEAEIKSERMFF